MLFFLATGSFLLLSKVIYFEDIFIITSKKNNWLHFSLTPDHLYYYTVKWSKNNFYFWFSTAFKILKHIVPAEITLNNFQQKSP
jgi:hypothetical protein